MIRVPQVRVVDEEGNQMGVLSTPDALQLAQERGYDLVEVAPMAVPPVTRLLDYGQFKYEQARREKEARRHQRSVDFKELRLKVKIGKGDFDTKVRRSIEFLEEGDRVKVTVQFRGREVSHAYLGRDLLLRFAEQVGEHAQLERQPLLEGKQMSLVMASTHKPKTQQAPAGQRADDATNATETQPKQAEPAEAAAKAAAKATEAPATEAKAKAAEPEAVKVEAPKARAAKARSTKSTATKSTAKNGAPDEPAVPAPTKAPVAESGAGKTAGA
jgi:translation initiation factor IF-3